MLVLVVASLALPAHAAPVEPSRDAIASSPTGAASSASARGVEAPDEWTAPAVADQLIVVTESVSDSGLVAEEAEDLGGDALKRSGTRVLAEVPEGQGREDFADELERLPGVLAVQPNYLYRASWVPNDPSLESQWGLARIGAPAAWNVARGQGAVVAVVDTGIDATHPDLVGRVDTSNGYDFVNADRDPMDDEGHGTHVAGIIAATADNGRYGAGVAPQATILPVKVLNRYGDGDSWKVANGITYAANHGADVINLSLGGRTSDSAIGTAIQTANARGVLVVAAAGNGGVSGVDYPSRFDGVLAVGAVDSAGRRASFSNYGTGLDIVAPGSGIVSTALGGGTDTMSGTSMAAAFVSGVAALVASVRPEWSGAQIQAHLLDTTEQIGTSTYYGKGIVRADKALSADADDDIPGVALDPSPVAGSLDSSNDVHDVRFVDLGAGQDVSLTVTGPTSSDFDLALFGPGSTSVSGVPVQVTTPASTYPKTITYRAPATGRYYIDLRAVAGSGAYTLTWSASGEGDDAIPGIQIPASPFARSLSETDDKNDVYRVYIEAGQQLSVLLSGAPHATDFNLHLYGPDAQSLAANLPVLNAVRVGSFERFRYIATRSGYHYLDVRAEIGAGPYTITWFSGPPEADDNIPGVQPTSGLATGSVDYSRDSDDVYKVWLGAGQRFSAVLDVSGSDKLDLYAFGPASTSVDDDDYLSDTETQTTYPRRLSLVAKESGYHFIDVFAHSGSGTYELSWSVDRHPDDDLPGVKLPASPVTGSLGTTSDTDDVYRVYLAAGQSFSAALSAPAPTATSPGTDFSLQLFAPQATSFRSDIAVVQSTRNGYPRRIDFVAPKTGDYYLHVHALAGTAKYSLSWAYKTLPKVTKSPTGSAYTLVRRNGSVSKTLSATVKDFRGRAIAGKKVQLQRSANGTSWASYGSASYTNSSGYVSKRLTFRTRQAYYWRWYSPSDSKRLSATSSKTKLTVR